MIFGGFELYFTVLVIVVVFPALSFAMTVIVLFPDVNVTSVLNVPLLPTVTALPLTVTVTGEDVASLVVPDTVIVFLFVTYPSDGELMLRVGGTVSILNVTDFCEAALPS